MGKAHIIKSDITKSQVDKQVIIIVDSDLKKN